MSQSDLWPDEASPADKWDSHSARRALDDLFSNARQ
jgi:hypothetical protein